MTTTAGHSFYIGPIGSFYNQVNDTGSWEPLIADLRFVSIYLWQNKRIGEKDPSLMRHIYKRFFSKIEELRNYVKKKRTDIGTMPWIRKKIKIGLCYGAKLF
jgi:hypothetical protein